ncbi:MAG: porin family protein [Bacteroidota bacterium]|nr:porin family protein [Bacteroidota bacterium]
MKKTLLIIGLTLASSAIFAGTKAKSDKPGIGIGVRLGANLSQAQGGYDLPSGLTKAFKGSFIGGLVFNIPVANVFSVQPELLFAQSGIAYNYSQSIFGTTLSYTVVTNINYFQIPILAQLNFAVSDKIKINFGVGPYLALALGGNTSYTSWNAPSSISKPSDVTYSVKKGGLNAFDFGIVVSPGISIKAGPGEVIADFRFTYGFLDIFDPKETTDASIGTNDIVKTTNYKAFNNMNLGLSVGYIYRLGSK